jgi:hypothetical protein
VIARTLRTSIKSKEEAIVQHDLLRLEVKQLYTTVYSVYYCLLYIRPAAGRGEAAVYYYLLYIRPAAGRGEAAVYYCLLYTTAYCIYDLLRVEVKELRDRQCSHTLTHTHTHTHTQ